MNGRFWIGMLIGAATGAGAALLYAPKRGEELRQDIKDMARDTGRKAGATWGNMKHSASDAAGRAGEKVHQATDKAKQTVQEAARKGGSMAGGWRNRAEEAVEAGKQAASEKRRQMEAELKARES